MIKPNDEAMAIPAIAFGVFCLFAVVVSIMFVVGINAQQAPVTDTFGSTIGPTGNQSQNLVTGVSSTSTIAMVPVVLIGGVVVLIAVLFGFWAFSKTGVRF